MNTEPWENKTVKVISLQQPWATAVVKAFKLVETRSRNTKLRGSICIHASQRPTSQKERVYMQELCKEWPFTLFVEDYNKLPFGAIIGQTDIIGTAATEWIEKHHSQIKGIKDWKVEKKLGDYSAGRYGYLLENSFEYEMPIPAKGSVVLGWPFEMPGHFHLPLSNLQGGASFSAPPSKELFEAVNNMAEMALTKIKK